MNAGGWKRELDAMKMNDLREHVVVLVHGTWGRGVLPFLKASIAPWCKEGSALRESISAALGKGTIFDVLNWSGGNTPGARLKAAKLLGDLLIQIRQRQPTAKIHLVAHSHGGNVLLYALADLNNRQMVSSSIFLSTPFLHIKPRILGIRFGRQIEVLAPGLTIIIALGMYPLLSSFSSLPPAYVLTGCSLVPILITLAVFMPRLLRRLHSWSHRFAERMVLLDRLPFPVLIVRGSADEAASALGGVQFVSMLLTKLLRLLLILIPPAEKSANVSDYRLGRILKLCLWFMLAGFSVFLLWLGAAKFFPWMNRLPVAVNPGLWLGILAGTALILLPVTISLLIPLAFMVVTLLAAVLLPFGAQNALAALSMHISAEATPPGEWTVVQLAPSTATLEEERGLSHFTHSNVAALRAVEAWLAKLVAG
jgi:hypothetical protein